MVVQDILNEVKKRADDANHIIQLFAIDLYKRDFFEKTHFSGTDRYAELHRELHRTTKCLENYSDLYDWEQMHYLTQHKERLKTKIEQLKIERNRERETFTFNFLCQE